jgi:hypothetical protein
MEVRIVLDQFDPPVGRLEVLTTPWRSGDSIRAAVPFIGWLGLLRALSDAIGSPGGPPGAP